MLYHLVASPLQPSVAGSYARGMYIAPQIVFSCSIMGQTVGLSNFRKKCIHLNNENFS